MAFNRIDKAPRGPIALEVARLRMSCHNQGGKNDSRGVGFSLTQTLVNEIGWEVIELEKRRVVKIAFDEGCGEDAGFLMLSQDSDGYAIGTSKEHAQSFTGSVSLTKFRHYVLNEVPVPSTDVEFTLDKENRTILVQCPDWLRYNSLSYQEPPHVPQRRAEDKKPSPPMSLRAAGNVIAAEVAPELNRKQRRAMVSKALSSIR